MPKSQSGFAPILVIILLLIGLAAAVYLVQTKTNFFPHAASGPISGPISKTPTPTPAPYLTITDPAAGTVWKTGQTVRIKWNYSGNIKLDIYVKSTTNPNMIGRILTGGNNFGFFDWVVSSDYPTGNYQVLLRGSSGSQSDSGIIKIEKVSYLTITKPAPGEVVQKGGKYRVTWDSAGNSKVDIYWRSVPYPAKIARFATGVNNVGYFDLDTSAIPINNNISEQFQILIRGSDGSSNDSAAFTLTAPVSKRVFITRGGYSGALNGLSGADKICQDTANSTKLGGIWKAWLSDSSTSVKDRMTHSSGPYKLTNNTIVADNWNQLVSGWILAAINIDDLGRKADVSTNVSWSGTDQYGVKKPGSQYCNNWSSSSQNISGGSGDPSYSDSTWTDAGSLPCSIGNHLYCFEQ
jgi:hypothetical protein